MWVEFGRRNKDSEGDAGQFSGSIESKWGASSAAFAHSIATLRQTAWEEIEASALQSVKHGKQSKVTPNSMQNVRACIIDCGSDDDNDSFNGLMGNNPQEQAITEQNMEHSYDETIFARPSPSDASEIPEVDPHATNPQHVPLQPLVSPDVAGYSDSQPCSVVAADRHLPPLMSPFTLKTSATFPPAPVVGQPSATLLPASQFSICHSSMTTHASTYLLCLSQILASQISIWLVLLRRKLVIFSLKTTSNLVTITPTLLFLTVSTHSHTMVGS